MKYVRNQLVFAPPKYGTGRDVPLSDALVFVLSEQLRKYPPVVVELPWGDPKTPKVRRVKVPLVFTSRERKALNRNYINQFIWKPALMEAVASGRPRNAAVFVPSPPLSERPMIVVCR